MIATFALAAALLQGPTCEPSKPSRPFVIAVAVYDVAAATDIAVSTFVIGQGSGREAFDLFRNRPVALSVTKLSLAAAATYGLTRLHRYRPKLAFWMTVAATGIEIAVTARNAKFIRPVRP